MEAMLINLLCRIPSDTFACAFDSKFLGRARSRLQPMYGARTIKRAGS